MNESSIKKRRIETLLSLYDDFLLTLSGSIGGADYRKVREEAFGILDRTLTAKELSALLAIEGSLKDRFPGVRNRIKELLRAEITRSLTQEKE